MGHISGGGFRMSHDSNAVTRDQLTVVCAWCDREMRHGGKVISHGICPACTEKLLWAEPLEWRHAN